MSNQKFSFKIEPLFTLSENNILSTLVEIDTYTFLFDCGIDEKFSYEIVEKYKSKLNNKKLDAIFISNNYLNYFGALPIIKSLEINKDTPIYASTPIAKLGYFILTDSYISALEASIIKFDKETKDNFSNIFFNIKDVIYEQIIKLHSSANDNIINIIPYKSGYSLGGTVWSITYKLIKWLYCPQFSVDTKEIISPFNYRYFKGYNYIITDSLINPTSNAVQAVIDIEFEKQLNENLTKSKNIFIPCDSVNMTTELIIRLEKVLDDFNKNLVDITNPSADLPETVDVSSIKQYDTNNINSIYYILVCGFCSNEITEGVKRVLEFMGTSIKKSFHSYNDSYFNFKWTQCAKSYDDFMLKYKSLNQKILLQNYRYIILASSEFLTFGMSHMIVPRIITEDNNVIMILKADIKKHSFLEKLVASYFSAEKKIQYERRNVVETYTNDLEIIQKEIEKKENKKKFEEKLIEDNIQKKKDFAMLMKRKLFDTKSQFLMFNYSKKNKFSDYGINLSEKDISMMKSSKLVNKENYIYNFNNLNSLESEAQESEDNLMKYEIPIKVTLEKKTLDIKCKFAFFNLFTNIDLLSKSIILNDMNVKNDVIFLGTCNNVSLSSAVNTNSVFLKANQNFTKNVVNNIIKFKYDSSIIQNAKKCFVFNGDTNVKIYEVQPLLLRVKRNRDNKDFEISSLEYMKNNNIYNSKSSNSNNNLDKCERAYCKGKIKLADIQKMLEKELNEDFYIYNHILYNKSKNVGIKFDNNELVLEGSFSQDYFKIRNIIYDYMLQIKSDNH